MSKQAFRAAIDEYTDGKGFDAKILNLLHELVVVLPAPVKTQWDFQIVVPDPFFNFDKDVSRIRTMIKEWLGLRFAGADIGYRPGEGNSFVIQGRVDVLGTEEPKVHGIQFSRDIEVTSCKMNDKPVKFTSGCVTFASGNQIKLTTPSGYTPGWQNCQATTNHTG